MLLWKVEGFLGGDGHPCQQCWETHWRGPDKLSFAAIRNDWCTFQTRTPRRCFQRSYHTQTWSCRCKSLNVWVRRKIDFRSKRMSSTLLWCSVLKALLLCQPSPVSTTFVSVRVETEPGKYQQLWKPPSSSRLCATKKPIHYHHQYY